MSDLSRTMLGSTTPYAEPGNPCSGYLVSGGETHVWLDAGAGTLGELRRHTSLDRLSAISHVGPLLTAGEAVTRAVARCDGPVAYAAPGAVFHLPQPRLFVRFLLNRANCERC